ncbi:hypothetical protein BO86DRAFT_15763 [Aspergillus japonicus CBS 114.51]|uniref:C2H2-type domain-containing protein n=1 Tax=Aspergillus japonicus CBS 114.51 TaxID=1448312 RepID=A0A8T8WL33_ASPJA|nr:hypothetical protein BO86DRAFT_15763 [Aspergillus japonicus CBS 114.51]RAH76423.1 hypothetical protein BO86DRAFT_15763 [Aspergillus japonicus CBS 114.51]
MRASRHNALWEESNDILRGINGSRATPTSSQKHTSADGLTPPAICLDSSASLMGFQFGSDSAVPPPHLTSILGRYFPYHDPASPPLAQSLEYSQYPLARFPADQDVWTPLQVTALPTHAGSRMCPPMGASQQWSGLDRRLSTGHYSTPSEADSQYASLHPSESGYSTQSCTTRSVAASYALDSACSPYSAPFELEQDERLSVLDLNTASYGDPIDVLERMQSPSLLGPDAIKCDYSDCQWTGKCPSDKRKHEARHRKLFKCDEPGCTRKDGFGTINDLARHKKCVHKQEPERGPKVVYMCFGVKCPRKNKRWPRLDNFRQHLTRMHNDEDAEELLRKSQEWYEDCFKPQVMGSSLMDHLSEASSPQMEDMIDESRNKSEDPQVSPSLPYARARVELDTITPDSVRDEQSRPSLSHATLKSAHRGPQAVELPPLNSLSFDGSPSPRTTFAAQSDISRGGKRDDMVAEAAMNLITAMTKSMTIVQQRQGQHSEDAESAAEQKAELVKLKREILQTILTTALGMLNQSSEPYPHSHQLQEGSSAVHPDQRKWIQCEFCSKKTRLRCEMKKHQKRHERPYSCTSSHCNKTFGSKEDWKRHENSQHFHSRSWRCTLPDATKEGLPCARLFYRQQTYIQHLKKQHEMDAEDEVRAALSDSRISRDGRASFWCGFCRKDVPLGPGLEAWNERFDHIDTEHYKKGERIEDWVLSSDQLTGNRELHGGNETMSADVGCESEPAIDEHSGGDCAHSHGRPKEGEYLFSHHDQMLLDDDDEPARKRPTAQSRGPLLSTSPQSRLSYRLRNTRKRKYSVLHPAPNVSPGEALMAGCATPEPPYIDRYSGSYSMDSQSQPQHTL